MPQLEGSHIHKLAQKYGKEPFTIRDVSKTLRLNMEQAKKYCWNHKSVGQLNAAGEDDDGNALYSVSRDELNRQEAILSGKAPRRKSSAKKKKATAKRRPNGILKSIRSAWATTAGGEDAFNAFVAGIALNDPTCHERVEKQAVAALANLIRKGK
jgi:hypothetical protein